MGYAKRRRGKASLSLGVQQYSSGTGHHVVESKRRALHVVGGLVYVRVGHISRVNLAHRYAPEDAPLCSLGCTTSVPPSHLDIVLP